MLSYVCALPLKIDTQKYRGKTPQFFNLTLKFSTRTPKVPFGPLGGACGIALFTARAPGGLRALFFVSRGGSGAPPGRLGDASGAPLGRPGGVPGHPPATSGRLLGSVGGLGAALGRSWGPLGTSRAPRQLPGGCEAAGI